MRLVHATVGFCDGAPRFTRDAHRLVYLRCLGLCVQRTDWRVLSYCLMDDRIHLGLEAGEAPLDALVQPLHAGLTRRWSDGSPVFARRYELAVTDDRPFAGHMISFHHNAPVRAGVATTAWDSAWSSHRAYLRLAPRPSWLSAARGLLLCGLADDAAGRMRFDEATHRRSVIAAAHWLSPEYVTLLAAGKRTLLRTPDATPVPLRRGDTQPESRPAFLREPIPVPITREFTAPHKGDVVELVQDSDLTPRKD